MKNFSVDDYLKNFPFYSNEDRRFRYVRDIALGVEAYNDILETMMQKQNIDMDEFSNDLWMKDQHVLELHSKNHMIGLHSHTPPNGTGRLTKRSLSEMSIQVISTL